MESPETEQKTIKLEIPFQDGPISFELLKISDGTTLFQSRTDFDSLFDLLEKWIKENKKLSDKNYQEYIDNRSGVKSRNDLCLEPQSILGIDSVDNTLLASDNDASRIDFFRENFVTQKSPKSAARSYNKFGKMDRRFENFDFTKKMSNSNTTSQIRLLTDNYQKIGTKVFAKEGKLQFDGFISMQRSLNFLRDKSLDFIKTKKNILNVISNNHITSHAPVHRVSSSTHWRVDKSIDVDCKQMFSDYNDIIDDDMEPFVWDEQVIYETSFKKDHEEGPTVIFRESNITQPEKLLEEMNANKIIKKETNQLKKLQENQSLVQSYYPNGKLEYSGSMILDKKEGYGEWYYSNGKIRYSGQFKNNQIHGERVKVNYSNEKLQYEGTFIEGKKDGFVICYYDNGIKCIEGYYKQDQLDGDNTKIYWSNGKQQYYGTMKAGKCEGYGKTFFQTGALRYNGEWKNDWPHGENATLYKENGDIGFQGQLIEGKTLTGKRWTEFK